MKNILWEISQCADSSVILACPAGSFLAGMGVKLIVTIVFYIICFSVSRSMADISCFVLLYLGLKTAKKSIQKEGTR